MKSWKMKFGMGVFHDHPKKRNKCLSCFLFFFGRNFGSKWMKKSPKKVKMYLFKQKKKKKQKRPTLRVFVWSWKTLPIFVFQLLFNQGAKACKPKCSGSSWNQLVAAFHTNTDERQDVTYQVPDISKIFHKLCQVRMLRASMTRQAPGHKRTRENPTWHRPVLTYSRILT